MKIDARIAWLADGYKTKLFEDDALKDAAIRPTHKDNFILTPEDDPKTFVEYNIGGQSNESPQRPKHAQRRIKSASSVRLQDRPWRQPTTPSYPAGFVPRRPASAIPSKTRSLAPTPTPRRIKSAGSARAQTDKRAWEVVDELKKGFTLVNKLYENDYKCSNIRLHPASPAPDYRYFDRHARCYNHTHAHKQPLQHRPQPACEKYLEVCGSRAISPARPDDPNVQPQRYIDYHRPRTAPTTRTELQYIPRPSYVYRGHTPHFCNFVQQVPLHSKTGHAGDSFGIPDCDIGDDVDFVMESAEGRIISKYRKSSASSSNGSLVRGMTKSPRLEDYDKDSIPEIKEDAVISGTEGRPASPSSIDGDSRLDEESPKPHVTEVRVSSPVKSEVSVKSNIVKESPRIKPKPKVEEKRSSSRSSNHSTIKEENEDRNKGDKSDIDNDAKSQKSTDSVVIPSGESVLDDRPPSPREPPPSPDLNRKLSISTPPPPSPPPAASKKKACVTKKTKKPVERTRKMKPIEEPKEAPPPPVEEAPLTEEKDAESEEQEGKVDLKVPELPSNLEKKDKQKKDKGKAKKHLIEVEDDLYKLDQSDLLNEQMRQNRSEFDWSTMDMNGVEDTKKQTQIKSWIQGRLALSQQSSRFELPMDMKNLETMTPQEYIKKHCIITSRRQNLYQKIFLKNKDKSQTILYKDLDRSLKDVLVNTIDSEQIHGILKTLEIDENTKVDYKLFAGMAAYSERVLYPKFVTEDTHDMPEYQREKIECADFCALDWKIHGVNISPQMLNVLKQIC